MALHQDEVSMLKESLPEYLELARLGLSHHKEGGGALGYPTATLLLAVVDAIGSYYRKDPNFRVKIDGGEKQIRKTGDHIFILNSDYFGCTFTKQQLLDIYLLCRCPLTHNSLLGKGHLLEAGSESDRPFAFRDGLVVTSVAGLLRACRTAVERFMPVLEKVVPKSEAVQETLGVARAYAQTRGAKGSLEAYSAQASAQASGIGRKV